MYFQMFAYASLIYSTTQMQVDGLTWVLALALKCSRTNSRVENVSVWHKHNTNIAYNQFK